MPAPLRASRAAPARAAADSSTRALAALLVASGASLRYLTITPSPTCVAAGCWIRDWPISGPAACAADIPIAAATATHNRDLRFIDSLSLGIPHKGLASSEPQAAPGVPVSPDAGLRVCLTIQSPRRHRPISRRR